MVSLIEKFVHQGVLLVGDPRPRIPLFLSFHARGTPTIMVRTFITLEETFGTNEVRKRIFITLDGPPEALEGIVVLIKYNTPMGVVPVISCPMGIPPKPPNLVAISIISTRGDRC